jgi:hypothetical protein
MKTKPLYELIEYPDSYWLVRKSPVHVDGSSTHWPSQALEWFDDRGLAEAALDQRLASAAH